MARIEVFLVWESNCRNILDELGCLPDELLDEIKLRIFMRKDKTIKSRPPTAKWIELYDCFTTQPFASDTAFLIKYFKDLAFLSDEFAEDETNENGFDPVEFYFVVDLETERKFDELIALFQQDASSKVKISTINGQVEDISKTMGFHSCKICCKAFENEGELRAHNGEYHNIFCDYKLSPKSKAPFGNEDEANFDSVDSRTHH